MCGKPLLHRMRLLAKRKRRMPLALLPVPQGTHWRWRMPLLIASRRLFIRLRLSAAQPALLIQTPPL
jgi:hypothetical protein